MTVLLSHQVLVRRKADGSSRRVVAIGTALLLLTLIFIARRDHQDRADSLLLQQLHALTPSSLLALNDGMTASLAENSNLCSKKAEIFEKLDQLLKRLQGENSLVNSTVDDAKDTYEESLEGWLASESSFRMAASKVEIAKEAAKFLIRRVVVDKEVLTKTEEEHAKVLEEYPQKIAMTEDEKALIMHLIELIESMSNKGKSSQKAWKRGASELSSKMRALQSRLRKDTFLGQSAKMRQQLTKIGLAIQKEDMLQSGGSKDSDIESTQDEIKNLLLDLLKDPEFRAMMLKAGLANAMNELLAAQGVLITDETKLTDTTHTLDASHHEELVAGLARSKEDGKKTVAADTYNAVNAGSKTLLSSMDKQIIIINVIKSKINNHCDNLLNPESQPDSASSK
ncbi:hypothetical protein GUITHDRAFT_145238 [Guillardia theta CCMP2712]|uniref:Uncharacterized protein n=1 Tax=Guillardia theta (strain CCMP2712) TaxID=905079 RepID=L1IMW8_GUITC|nr:hypothetical protein GUITHDRAFT_145238 [Guillardia theta CCMP2712]EKX37135.1 hypothetical protein GUITHDRAFT_145238 [Guillardia theta CCMP2712]|eukprot:XP_005824115.1 hypothetical protein GUITHDRAFT_145238 [Guillardia theta CCMP2712]